MKAKKFYIIALVLAIVLLIAPISESWAEEESDVKISGDYEYIVLGDETACITKYNGKDEKVIIPEELDGIRVTGIGDGAFSWKDNLKEITIPDSVENIGANPFDLCHNLSNINISANHPTLAFIDNVLFYKPEKKLVIYLSTSEESKYEIPEGTKIIGDSAFYGCRSLTEITIPNSVEFIGDNAFGCTSLTEITIPDNVKYIGNWAFSSCDNLEKITISDSVENIGINPFERCNKLLNIEISANHPTLFFLDNVLFYKPEKKIVSYLSASEENKYEIPNGIELVGNSAFSYCTNLTEITIPNSVQLIDNGAFFKCTNLTEITIPNGVQSIGNAAFFYCENLTKINIEEGVKSIGYRAFSSCKNLKEVKIPDSLEKIENNIFYGCNNLSNIIISANNPTVAFVDNALIYKPEKKLVIYLSTSKESKYEIPEEIEIIGDNAFSKCTNLTEITIPESVQSIDEGAFSNCEKLTEINISDSVQSIGKSAFFKCINLKKINIPASVNTIGEDVFKDCDNLTATVEKGSFAEEYCKENNIKYMYEDSLDWLKN